MNKCLIVIIIVFMCACGEDDALKEETLYISSENKEWLTTDEIGTNFTMIDNNNIVQSFSMNHNSSDYSPSTTSYFGVKTKVTKTESYTQGYSSNYGQRFSTILTAGFAPFGDDLSVSINDLSFTYDFKFKTIARINYESNYKSKLMTDKGYEEKDKIYSTVEIFDTLTVNGYLYSDILHFNFDDFNDVWSKFTVRELFIAKHYGLIKYSLESGIKYERQR